MDSSPEAWPPELDALCAAPDHHRLVLENDAVRVLETRIEAGETVPVHTHCWPAVYHVFAWSDMVRRDAEGVVLLDTRGKPGSVAPGQSVWAEPLGPHSLENVGEGPIHLISVEIKPAGDS